jgi:capsular polysaccharide biosynthesis protein
VQAAEAARFAELESDTHPEVFRAVLPEARIAGSEPLVLTDDLRVLLESAYDRHQLEANPVSRARLHRARRLRGAHAALLGPWYHNHFHWMLDVLPRARLLPAGLPVLVPRDLSRVQLESLERVGVGGERLEPFDLAHVQVEELHWPSWTARTGRPSAWAAGWLRDRLGGGARGGARRIYVTRGTADARLVANEREVRALLRARGFEAIDPGRMSLREQLSAFSEAEVVVGAHGGALAGIVAARAACLVELFDPRWLNGCYYALAEALGLDYWLVVGEAAGRWHARVPLDALAATLDRIP